MNSTGSKLPRKYLLGIISSIVAVATSVLCSANFSKTKELAFIATLNMASEIGNDGAAGDSGVLQSINISSDSPSAISDSFSQSAATAGTKNHRNFLSENWHLLLSLCYSSILTLFTVVFPQGHPKVIINQSVKAQQQQTISQQERATFQSLHWCSRTYLLPLSLKMDTILMLIRTTMQP